jgi:hypothetical protein
VSADLQQLRLRALVELRGGAYERAIEAADKVLLKQPGDPDASRYRSQAQEHLKQQQPPSR